MMILDVEYMVRRGGGDEMDAKRIIYETIG